MMVLCLLMQATFVTLCVRRYARFKRVQQGDITRLEHIGMLAAVMLLMLIGNLAQVALWAVLFVLLGEFGDFETALYHSAVNYAGLGYGDIVMSEHRRLLGPLEAANGVLMFGVSTALMTAAVFEVIKHQSR
jgi:hypothetical protein